MDRHSTGLGVATQPPSQCFCAAHSLGPSERQQLALDALAGADTIRNLADDHQVSRKFVYQQKAIAQQAVADAFAPAAADDRQVLFYLPVTKAWLRQLVLALVLICHSSYRGVVELLRDLFDFSISLGSIHAILNGAVAQARPCNSRQNLGNVRIGAHDEIFQSGQPVLVGCDVFSTYCYLLSLEQHRDGDTWGVRLLELQERAFAPNATIADAGKGLRAGQRAAMPNTPCRGDVFHALMEAQALAQFLENRAYQAMTMVADLERKITEAQRRQRPTNELTTKLQQARPAENQAIRLADDVALLVRWLRHDVLALAGPDYRSRCSLFDFIVAELQARAILCPHRIGPVARALKNQRDDLLAFVVELDDAFAGLAEEFALSPAVVRELFNVQTLEPADPRRWPKEAALRQQLRGCFHPLCQAVGELAERTVRASSVVENLNSRLRSYFFLRRQLGPDYLALLQFFLNHRRFLRSEHPERVGKSPAELLTGHQHPHWLETLGYTLFSRN
jgi:hypothetical protein